MVSPNQIETASNYEGFLEEGEALSLNLSEEDIVRIVGKRVTDGEAFWEKQLSLKSIRERNEKRWRNKNFEVSGAPDLYEHQQPNYRDNRIFVSIESLVSSVVSRIPQPVVTEAFDSDASRELATGYSGVLKKKAEDLYLKERLQMAARHLLMGYRTGIIKYTWDFSAGRMKKDGSYIGDIKVETVRPHKIVVDAEANDPDDIPLIGEYVKATVEELIIRFPKRKQAILDRAGIKAENRSTLGQKLTYLEVWFTYYDGEKRKEGVCWKLNELFLGAGVNPYYNYNKKTNFFDRPQKPYVFFSFLTDGEWVFDKTSLTEQAASLQDNLEKRGRQISDNADQAESTMIFNTNMINDNSIEEYVGDPKQSIKVDGDVRMAFKREPPPMFPRYVIEDKLDSRNEVDNIFGTHQSFRGEQSANPTLGQDVLSQKMDLGRTAPLTDAIERGAIQVYRGMTQLYKVFATEEHMVKYTGPEGRTIFTAFSADKIEDGIQINIQAGSMQPDDKTADKNESLELAKIGGRIDPLTFFEKWHLSNPKEAAKRLFYFLFMPDRYAEEVLGIGGGQGAEDAKSAISRISVGDNVPPPKTPSKEYLAMYAQFVKSPAFKQLPPEIQRLHMEHLKATVEVAKQGLSGQQEQPQPGQPEQKPGLMDKIKGMFGGGNAAQVGQESSQ